MATHTGITKIIPHKDYMNLWKRKNPDKIKEYRIAYKTKNKEKIRKASQKRYRNKHPDTVLKKLVSKTNLLAYFLKSRDLDIEDICFIFSFEKRKGYDLIRNLKRRGHTLTKPQNKYHLVKPELDIYRQ